MGARAVFLDRDGTINTEEDFLSDPSKLRFEEGAVEGLRALSEAGFALVVVSNQSGVARGLFSEDDVKRVHKRLEEMLVARDVRVEGFYYCPHYPDGSVPRYAIRCDCRKPAPGLFLHAARDLGIDLGASYTVGDRARDLEAGRRAGTKSVLVRTGYGESALEEVQEMKLADFIAADLQEAARWIVNDSSGAKDADDDR